jgi:hypothetical protein
MSTIQLVPDAPTAWRHAATLRLAGRPIRAPHHTVSERGALLELAVSAGGVLVISEAREFHAATLAMILRVWADMHPSARPVLVVDMGGTIRGECLGSFVLDPLAWLLARTAAVASGSPVPEAPQANHGAAHA